MMIVAAARELAGTRVCFVGVGLPNIAVNLAKRTVAPDLELVSAIGRTHAGRVLGDVLSEPRLTARIYASAGEAASRSAIDTSGGWNSAYTPSGMSRRTRPPSSVNSW